MDTLLTSMPNTMIWQDFKEALLPYPGLDLQFQYAENKWVGASYHITEIKQSSISSVDCGGVMNNWKEIIVQLWEPSEKQQEKAMKVRKALSIIEIVEKKLQLESSAPVKIEFGNSQFDTRQMYPGNIQIIGEDLIVDLQPDFTQCKAIGRGGSCGTEGKEDQCCSPAEQPMVKLKNLAVANDCCTPGAGCC